MGFSVEGVEARVRLPALGPPPTPREHVPSPDDVLILRQRLIVLARDPEKYWPLVQELERHSLDAASERLEPARFPLQILRTWTSLRRLRPEILLLPGAPPSFAAVLAARFAKVNRIVLMIDELGSDYAPGGGWKVRLARWLSDARHRIACRIASTVIVANKDDRALVVRRFAVRDEARVRVAPAAGLDPDACAAEPLPDGVLTFLMIAPLTEDKGVAEFAEAARRLKEQQLDVRFVLVGAVQEGRRAIAPARLEAWVKDGRLVHVTGGDLRAWLRQAHVLVAPSYREGCPALVMEAMAMGRPCIVSDAPGLKDLVTHHRDGVIVQRQSAASLAEAMTMIVRTKGLIGPWARAAVETAREKFALSPRAAETAAAILGASTTADQL